MLFSARCYVLAVIDLSTCHFSCSPFFVSYDMGIGKDPLKKTQAKKLLSKVIGGRLLARRIASNEKTFGGSPTKSVCWCIIEAEAGLLVKRLTGQKDGGPARESRLLRGVAVREDETCH